MPGHLIRVQALTVPCVTVFRNFLARALGLKFSKWVSLIKINMGRNCRVLTGKHDRIAMDWFRDL